MSKSGIRAGDRAFVKVGRNLVEVRVEGKAEGGWSVVSRTGRAMTVKTLLNAQGETLAADGAAAATPTKAAKATAKTLRYDTRYSAIDSAPTPTLQRTRTASLLPVFRRRPCGSESMRCLMRPLKVL